MGANSKFKHMGITFFIGFFLSLAGMTFEDFLHNISVLEALSAFHHFIVPFCMGNIASIFGFLYWKRKAQQFIAANNFAENLHSILDINKSLVSSINLDNILQVIIDKSTHLINLDTGAIYLNEDDKLYLGATTPPLPEQFPDVFRNDLLVNHPHIQKSLITKNPTIVADTSTESFTEAEQAVVKARNLRSILYIPLIIENRPVGTIILGSSSSLRSFTEQEIDIYRTFSGQAALSIDNARLYKNSIHIANELRQQNEEFLTLNEELSENNLRIKKINEDLDIAKEKAEESNQLKTAFLNNMSHEVRTPLNAIAGFSQLMAKPNLSTDKLKLFSDFIISKSDQLIGIITDVIEVSQIQAKQIKIQLSDFEIVPFIENIAAEYSIKAKEKQIAFISNMNITDNRYTINSDMEKLRRTISHLINNALKFTFHGSIEINTEITQDNLQISISDTGIGISPEMQEIVFEPFRQVETGIIRNYGGNGLGLPIAKTYIELLGGSITLNSEINKGTTFIVSLSVNKAKQLAMQQKNKTKYSVKTILIAEDEYSNYQYLREIFDGSGLEILHAQNGQEALDLCRNNRSIDLILMDLKMPVMDGSTSAKLIKAFRPNLPIIVQTAYALENEMTLYSNDFDDYITKPINEDNLKLKLQKFML